ncbi:MAG: dolichol-phosphate mannosyltransferase [Acidobacteriota bacterium]
MSVRRLATVVAALDERENLELLVPRLAATLRALAGFEAEMIFVVAGTDGSAGYLEALGGTTVIRQTDRGGLAEAFRAGFAAVDRGADVVVTMDADLNHRPEELPRLLAALDGSGADIVVGSRGVPGAVIESASWIKRAASRIGNAVIGVLFGDRIRDRTSGYRVYRRPRLDELPVAGAGFSFLPAMLLAAERAGMVIVEEPISFDRRRWGHSKLPIVATTLGYLRLALQARNLGRRRRR